MKEPRKETLADWEQALRIDRDALDDSLLQFPDVFYRVSQRLTGLVGERDAAKQDLEELRAEVDADIRRSADIDGRRVTEPEIKNLVRLDEQVRKGVGRLAQLEKAVGEIAALKEALVQKSYVMKSLVELYQMGYFGNEVTSSLSRDARADAARRGMNAARKAGRNHGN